MPIDSTRKTRLEEVAEPRWILDEEGEVTGTPDSPLHVETTPSADWEIALVEDVAVNDSDKTVVVPGDQEWHVCWIYSRYISDANAGNRQLVVEVENAGLKAELARAGTTQAASLTRYYMFAPGLADLTGFRDTVYLTTPIPVTTILKPGDTIRVRDNAAVSAAGDNMLLYVQFARRSV